MIFDIINSDPGFISGSNLDELSGAGIYHFASCDKRSDFLESLQVKPKDWYYRHNPVNYTLNSHKFRTKEFKDIDWKNSIVLLGCSYTFGVGVTDDDTISAQLEKITGKPVVNLGQPGVSNAVIAYNSYYLKENYPKPLAVVNLWTGMFRWFQMTHGGKKMMNYVNFRPSDSVDNINTEIINNIMYMKMSNALWKDHPNHIQTCIEDGDKDGKPISITQKVFPEAIMHKRSWTYDTSARDNVHPGREVYGKIAKMIASNLKL
jgi:hypothetical protein